MWLIIIYHCLIYSKQMKDVTHDRSAWLILYAGDIDINVGVVILSKIKKVHYHHGRKYGFGGLLTRFLRGQEIEEEALYYRPVVNMRPIDMTRTKELNMAHGSVLTMPSIRIRIMRLPPYVWATDALAESRG